MRRSPLAAVALVALCAPLAACGETVIVGSLETTTTTASTLPPPPTGDISDLLGQLAELTNGLGQVVIDNNRTEGERRIARAEEIWAVLEPQIREAGVDLVEEVRSIVDLIATSVNRRRPADGDKAQRFIDLIIDSVPGL
ncbi:MAG: hypothetical protein ACO3RB_08695 [Ilumatobacteraceae bacterium]